MSPSALGTGVRVGRGVGRTKVDACAWAGATSDAGATVEGGATVGTVGTVPVGSTVAMGGGLAAVPHATLSVAAKTVADATGSKP